MKLILHNVVCSLTSALDLVGVNEVHHGKRVSLMAANVAQTLGWSAQLQIDILYAGMLHDCGVSTTGEHKSLVSELDWSDSQNHCERGYQYLTECPPFSKYADWILYHHTHWSDLEKMDLAESDKLAANLIFLLDRVDFLQAKHIGFEHFDSNILIKKQRIIDDIQKYENSFFSPVLIDAFLLAAKKESFWLAMDDYYINASVQNYSELSPVIKLSFEEIRSIAELFSKVIDAKSTFTKEHSLYVALLSRFLAEKLDFNLNELQEIEIAGMLHDLGKLRVPDDILNKPGALTPEEKSYIARHSFDTVQLLRNVFPGTRIAEWAGFHHENLNGTGYPFHLTAEELDSGCKIIAVADTFQALVQNRPYRGTLTIEEILPIIDEMVVTGKLAKPIVEVLKKYQHESYAIASHGKIT